MRARVCVHACACVCVSVCVCVCALSQAPSAPSTHAGSLFLEEVSDSPASHSQVGKRALIFLTWQGWGWGFGGRNPSNWDIPGSREILVFFDCVNKLWFISSGHKVGVGGLKKIK